MPFALRLAALAGKAGDAATDAYRATVPAHYRLFASTVMGDRSPITEKNFSAAELKALKSIIEADRKQTPERVKNNTTNLRAFRELATNEEEDFLFLSNNTHHLADYLAGKKTPLDDEFFSRVGIGMHDSVEAALNDKLTGHSVWRTKERLTAAHLDRFIRDMGTIKYGENEMTGSYPDRLRSKRNPLFPQDTPVKVGPVRGGLDFGDRNVNALANTVGQFIYKNNPDGSATINDSYDWDNTHGGDRPKFSDALRTLLMHGSLEDLGAFVAPDPSAGRPIKINVR